MAQLELLKQLIQSSKYGATKEESDAYIDKAEELVNGMVANEKDQQQRGLRAIYTKSMEPVDIIEFFEQYGMGLHNPFDAMERIYLHNMIANPLDQIDVIKHSESYVAMFQNRQIYIKLSVA